MEAQRNKTVAILILFCNISLFATAQQKQGSNWLFGKGARIGFNTGTAVSDTSSKQNAGVGSGCISDAQGNLLFYTNGSTVWNRKNQVMPNGAGLLEADSNKSVLIQKKPGSESIYYIFVANNPIPGNLQTGKLYYSIVDMDQQNGLGDVLPMMKNVLLLPRVARMLAAAQHANGRDFWIIAHGYPPVAHTPSIWMPGEFDSTYYSFRLDSFQLNTTPITSNISEWSYMANSTLHSGWMRTSPNSRMIAMQFELDGDFVIAKLDRNSGKINREFVLSSDMIKGKGCFSADSKFFFLAEGGGRMRTFDLTLGDENTIQNQNKFAFIEHYGLTDLRPRVTDVQLGIDGKLYVNPYPGATFLSRINNPCKRYGPDVGWEPYAVDLKGRKCGLEFPVHNQTLFVNAGKLQAQAAKDTICLGDTVELSSYGAGAENFQWVRNQETTVFSTLSNVKVAPAQTTRYTVKGNGTCAAGDTSVTVVVLPRPVAQISSSGLPCSGHTLNFSTQTGAGWRYHWFTDLGSFQNSHAANTGLQTTPGDTARSGYVKLEVTNAGCTVQDSVQRTLYPTTRQKPVLSPFPDTAFCFGQSATLQATALAGHQTIWSTGDSSSSIVVSTGGQYSVRYKSTLGCLSDSSSTVSVTVHPLPIAQTLFNNKKDTTVCFPAQIELGISPQTNVQYNWQGPTDSLSNSNISNPGFQFANTDTLIRVMNYELWVMDEHTGCQNRDSLRVRLVPFLRPDAGEDVSFCNGTEKMIGKQGNTGFQYQWSPTEGIQNPNSAQTTSQLSNSSFEQIRSQNQIRKVSLLGCQASDTVQIQVFPSVPKPVLAGPQFVCPGVQNVPYSFSTLPVLNSFDLLVYTFHVSGGDSTGRFTANWNVENANAGIKLKLGNVYGCQPDSAFLPVNITRFLQPKTNLIPAINDSLCLASAQNIPYNILPFNPKSRYAWTFDPSSPATSSPTFDLLVSTFTLPGIYSLTLAESDTTPIAQCFGKTEYNIRIWPQPTAKQIVGKDSLCVNGGEELRVESEESNSQFSWTASLGTIENVIPNGGSVNYKAEFEPQTDFTTVKITTIETSEKGCAGPENLKSIVVESLPGPIILEPNEKLEWSDLQNRTYSASGREGSYFDWTAENGTISSGQGTHEIDVDWQPNQLIYRLKLREITRIGCIGETDFQVVPYDSTIFVPNLITQNGDGKNDFFEVKNLQFYPDNELTIYNRWGSKVFKASSYQQNWPTETVAEGTYFYYLKSGKSNWRGWVMVVR